MTDVFVQFLKFKQFFHYNVFSYESTRLVGQPIYRSNLSRNAGKSPDQLQQDPDVCTNQRLERFANGAASSCGWFYVHVALSRVSLPRNQRWQRYLHGFETYTCAINLARYPRESSSTGGKWTESSDVEWHKTRPMVLLKGKTTTRRSTMRLRQPWCRRTW